MCELRGPETRLEYGSRPGTESSVNKTTCLAQGLDNTSQNGGCHRSPVASQPPSLAISPTDSISPSTVTFSNTPESHRLLELELMHRWSTRTWMGFYSIPEDGDYLQVHIPRGVLKSSYLMNGNFATAAIDLARCSKRPRISDLPPGSTGIQQQSQCRLPYPPKQHHTENYRYALPLCYDGCYFQFCCAG
jgi:hypothetical protein